MTATYDVLLSDVRAACLALSYRDELVIRDYQYTDLLSRTGAARGVTLAAFAQEPTSYRTACLAIVDEPPSATVIAEHRSLGAPVVVSVRPNDDVAHLWRMTAVGDAGHIESLPRLDVPQLILRHIDDWGPSQILRAKLIAPPPGTRQLDFFDVGLLPALEREVREKLDGILREVLHAGVDALRRSGRAPSGAQIKELYRVVFRLLVGKVLADRRHPAYQPSNNAGMVLEEVQRVFLHNAVPLASRDDLGIRDAVWQRLRGSLDLSHISGEALAYVYENTLVSRETRKNLDIHATPPELADYIVRRLPFAAREVDRRRVFEPFSGHAPFLTAAVGQLKALLPSTTSGAERHEYLVRMLWGMELDAFAAEVAQQSLVLADYPHGNGWNILEADAFRSAAFAVQLERADAVICNPPYSEFVPPGKQGRVSKALEAMRRILVQPPPLLGVILPLTFVHGDRYREVRQRLDAHYDNVEVLELPDTTFQHADEQIAVVTAMADPDRHSRTRVAAYVHRSDWDRFVRQGTPSWSMPFAPTAEPSGAPSDLWRTPGAPVWEETAYLPRLESWVAYRGRGLEYHESWRDHEGKLSAASPRNGFAPGIANVNTHFEPYVARAECYLKVTRTALRRAVDTLRGGNKVIVNFNRLSRGPWALAAIVDRDMLAFYQNFIGIWPKADIAPELVAAVLNGPVANAYVAERELKRHVRVKTLMNVPVPQFSVSAASALTALVQQYEAARRRWIADGDEPDHPAADKCATLQREIDASVLAGYDLSPRIERALLDQFAGSPRPGPVAFERYYPPGYGPTLSYEMYLSTQQTARRVGDALVSAPVIPIDEDQATREAMRAFRRSLRNGYSA